MDAGVGSRYVNVSTSSDLRTLEALKRTILLTRDFVSEDQSDEVIVRALRARVVTLVADERNLNSPVGQTVLVTLCQLIVASGANVRLAIPEVPLLSPQPPLTGTHLRGALVRLAHDLMPGVSVRVGAASELDLAFIIGDSPAPQRMRLGWRVWARAWSGGIVPVGTLTPSCRGSWTLGASAAAAIAASEVFKAALRPIARPSGAVVEQLAAASHATLSLAPDTFDPGESDAGQVDFVSGGAINSAALHALLRLRHLHAEARIIEPEVLELSNLNRYPLARLSRWGWLKIDALKEFETSSFRIKGVRERFGPASAARLRPLAPVVVVGVDDIPSRWEVQKEWPRSLIVGATDHFTAVVSDHGRGTGCAGCFHPTDDGVQAAIPTAAFVSYLSGVLVASRLVLVSAGASVDAGERAIELASLRLDRPSGIWRHPVLPFRGCPVVCRDAA